MLCDRRIRIWGATRALDERVGLAKLGYRFEALGVASSGVGESLRRLAGDCDIPRWETKFYFSI